MTEYPYNPIYGAAAMPSPSQFVAYRLGAIPSLEMVNVVEEAVSKSNVIPFPKTGSRVDEDLQIFLLVKAWVKNVAFRKNVWIDVHLFDGAGQLIHTQTFTLHYLGPAGGDGDFFLFDGKVYQGSIKTPNSYDLRPDVRTVQYRLYYEVNNQVFTDGLLHQHELQEDSVQRREDCLLECRLSKSFLEALPDQAKPVFDSAANWVLFAYFFSYEEGHSLEEVEQMVWDALREAQTELASSLYIDVDAIEVHWGTVDIIIWLQHIAYIAQQHDIGPLAIWAGDSILKGALGMLGTKIMERFLHKTDVKNIEERAEKKASEIAESYRCRKVSITGGIKCNGKYQYTYQLIGCNIRTGTKRHTKNPNFTVTIDPRSKEPDLWEFTP